MREVRTIAFVGVGAMGRRMAAHLVRAGFAVRAWDPMAERSASVPGAFAAASPAEAASGADAIYTMSPDGAAAEASLFGASGAAAALGRGGLWIQSATIGIPDVERLGGLASGLGVTLVDAPVLGTTPHAEAGQLTILASGPASARAICDPVFAPLSERVFWLGPAGAGTRMKLVFNHWLHTLIGNVAESVALAEGLGVDPWQFFEVVDGSPADSPSLRGHGERMLAGRHDPGLALEHARKDVLLIADAARAAGVPLALAEALTSHIDRALAAGLAGRDLSAIHAALRPQ